MLGKKTRNRDSLRGSDSIWSPMLRSLSFPLFSLFVPFSTIVSQKRALTSAKESLLPIFWTRNSPHRAFSFVLLRTARSSSEDQPKDGRRGRVAFKHRDRRRNRNIDRRLARSRVTSIPENATCLRVYHSLRVATETKYSSVSPGTSLLLIAFSVLADTPVHSLVLQAEVENDLKG